MWPFSTFFSPVFYSTIFIHSTHSSSFFLLCINSSFSSHRAIQIKEEQLDHGVSLDSKNECDSTRNGDALNSGDEDSNHRCEVIETKPVSLNQSGGGSGNDSSGGSMDGSRMGMGFGDLGGGNGGGMAGNGMGGGGGNGNPGWDLLQLGRLREAFGNNGGNPGSSNFFNGIFANALGGGAAGKMNSLMGGAGGFPGTSGGGNGGGGFPSPGPSNQLPGIAQSFSNAPAWATGSMDMSNLFRNRTQFSDEQVAVLKAYYDVDKYPNAMRVAEIAAKIGVHVRVVNVWFQNSRAKEKRNMKWPSSDAGFQPPSSGARP